MPIAEPDYLEMWRELVLRGNQGSGSKFNKREQAEEYDQASKKRNKEKRDFLLELVKRRLGSNDTVLDVGAGTGRWAIPLAKIASKVTAVEPAGAMSDILVSNAVKEGVSDKIELIKTGWETADVGTADIVICIHAMYGSSDFASFVRKMEAHAKRRVYLGLRLFPVDGIIQELCKQIYGSIHDSPNFFIAYNALFQMGIFADVVMDEIQRTWTNETIEAAFIRAKKHLNLKDNPAYDGLIQSTLKRRLVFRDGLFHWPDGMGSALVSWNPTPRTA
jgi:SAM-dependent methyltransferase